MVSTFVRVIVAVFVIGMMTGSSDAGSPCPPREEIYPCLCMNIPLTKKQMFTDITCRHMSDTVALSGIFSSLRRMHIDRFILYDSFWEGDDHTTKRLPQNWFSLLKIKELQIIDSKLSHDIACDKTMTGCPNNVPTHLSVINSSSTLEFITYCQEGVKFSWISCMAKLQHFYFVNNKLNAINADFFEMPMKELLVANFSHNEISQVVKGAFRNLPKLTTLDLSHNKIIDVRHGIFAKETVISYLDLSWNFIKQLSPDIFKMTQFLTYFAASNNRIDKLPETDWKHLSKAIKTIDLSENPLVCDCHIIWINCTLKVHTAISGYCLNEGYENTPLRRVSKYMSERCVDGVIMLRENRTSRNACDNWDKNKYMASPVKLLDQGQEKSAMGSSSLYRVAPRRRSRSSFKEQLQN